MPPTFVTSDLHLGSPYFLANEFTAFLDALPPRADLILNGDTMDHWQRCLPPTHAAVLDRLRAESSQRRILWIYGNHDEDYRMPNPAHIEFATDYAIGKQLYVNHGFDFDNLMPRNRPFIQFIRALHHFRLKLGAPPMHVALYAKRFKLLYRILINHVATNAVEYAHEHGYQAVTCGHTHFVEDRTIEGVRYLNTGSWTEPPPSWLSISDTDIQIHSGGNIQ